jgi:hypothetical protein
VTEYAAARSLERRLCRRNSFLGEVSEGAVAPHRARLCVAPSD